jgi:hypothetical protein
MASSAPTGPHASRVSALLVSFAIGAALVLAWPVANAIASGWTTYWSPPTWASAGLAKTDAVWNNKIDESTTVAPCDQLWRMWELGTDGKRYLDYSAGACGVLDVSHASAYHQAYCVAVTGGTSNLLCQYEHT